MNSMSGKIKITIIEPSEIVSTGLKRLIESTGSFSIAKVFRSIQEYSELPNGNPDIIIINPTLVSDNGYADPKSLLQLSNNTVVVAINYGPYDEEAFRDYDAYISIFNTREQIEKRLSAAIKNTSDKETYDDSNDLSVREREILTAVAKGKTNKEIADEFNLSIHTVISHRKNISHKLGINSIAGLTIYAVMNKLLDVEDF